ncbi:hypothetical protein PoB_002639600 [Plakobranchus ocellatus]|uniref:Uncharacterized protein n=1 Tax=Plakobranchus ocellatus TaxID=259542 RepID=A0AAV3ZL98_9GAST|nr:hypothetical protein PoB_002639600 [Plakobranchus ocellatus]
MINFRKDPHRLTPSLNIVTERPRQCTNGVVVDTTIKCTKRPPSGQKWTMGAASTDRKYSYKMMMRAGVHTAGFACGLSVVTIQRGTDMTVRGGRGIVIDKIETEDGALFSF